MHYFVGDVPQKKPVLPFGSDDYIVNGQLHVSDYKKQPVRRVLLIQSLNSASSKTYMPTLALWGLSLHKGTVNKEYFYLKPFLKAEVEVKSVLVWGFFLPSHIYNVFLSNKKNYPVLPFVSSPLCLPCPCIH